MPVEDLSGIFWVQPVSWEPFISKCCALASHVSQTKPSVLLLYTSLLISAPKATLLLFLQEHQPLGEQLKFGVAFETGRSSAPGDTGGLEPVQAPAPGKATSEASPGWLRALSTQLLRTFKDANPSSLWSLPTFPGTVTPRSLSKHFSW